MLMRREERRHSHRQEVHRWNIFGGVPGPWLSSPPRLIDTASVYKNEEDVGEAIQELIAEGVVKREELFVTTKAWAHELIPGQTVLALREPLKRLRLDYVDLYLAHVPTAFNEDQPNRGD